MSKYLKAYYTGNEFPEYFGKEIEVQNDDENDCYMIRFVGESCWYDNMDDDDWSCTNPCASG